MDVSFVCPDCGAKLKFDAASYPPGTEVDCPDCSSNISIPRPNIGPGVTIGGFELKQLLGKGGMGEVYLARQVSMDRDVAVKILPASFGLREENIRRFQQEVKMAARLKESNIVRAHEAGEDLGVHFLAMEYVEGEAMDERLRRCGPFPEAEARTIVEKLARALSQLWLKHRMIHRDIKPANIILGEDGEPELMDMGVSKALDEGLGVTVSTAITGTPNYMSPEQVMGAADIDFRTDMYSLGATLYHMLTARVPFNGKTLMEVLHKQTTEEQPDPRDHNPAISPEMVAIIRRMMAKRPADRYSDWEEFIAALHAPAANHHRAFGVSKLVFGAGALAALMGALFFTVWAPPADGTDGAVDLSDGLVARWSFEEVNGVEILDSSGNERHGVIIGQNPVTNRATNAPPVPFAGNRCLMFRYRHPKAKAAVRFDPALALTDAVTVTAWAFIGEVKAERGLRRVLLRNVNHEGHELRLDANGHFRVQGRNGMVEVQGLPAERFPLEQWYHLAATYDGRQTRVHLNAEPVHEENRDNPLSAILAEVELGASNSRQALAHVAMDEVRIYDRVLSMREIEILAGRREPDPESE